MISFELTNALLLPGIAWSSQDPSVFASLSYDGRVCELSCNHKEHKFPELSVSFYFIFTISHLIMLL
jgi:hypothetical protein